MNYQQRHQIYEAQTQNVRLLERAFAQIVRNCNLAIRRSDEQAIVIETRLLLVTYDAWSEASLSKLIHTPHGFTLAETQTIKSASKRDIVMGWQKCIDIGLAKAKPHTPHKTLQAAKRLLKDAVTETVSQPRLIRNKVAHGQWREALNRENTKLDAKLTNAIAALDPVVIETLKQRHVLVSQCIEDLIESPDKAFAEQYWRHFNELQRYVAMTKNWNLKSKRAVLTLKVRKPAA